jgi:hypothetical protein
MKIAISLSLILGLAAASGAPAYAQNWMDRDRPVATDLRREQDPAEEKQVSSRRQPSLTIAVNVPLQYDSRPHREDSDMEPASKGDMHVAPDVAVRWSQQFPSFRLSASVGASVDRYFREKAASGDTLSGSVRLSWTDGKSDAFVPYFAYSTRIDYLPTFGIQDVVIHDFVTGVSLATGKSADGRSILARDASNPGDSSYRLTIRGGRRIADPTDRQNTFFALTADYTYLLSRDWSVSLSPGLRVRWYDHVLEDYRRDIRIGTALTATWSPDWLTKALPDAEIDFTFSVQRNYSTFPEENYTVWDLGPTLGLKWKI